MGDDSRIHRWLRAVPLWGQLLLAFATYFVAERVGEVVAVWYACGRLSAYFVDGVRIVKWKPDKLLSNGAIVAPPIELLVIFPLWIVLVTGSIWLVWRLRPGGLADNPPMQRTGGDGTL